MARGIGCALDCIHFERCDGCVHDKALEEPPVTRRARRFFEEAANPPVSNAWKLSTPRTHDWRCRARLVASRDEGREVSLGLYRRGTHDVVDIPECKAHHPRINEAAALLRTLFKNLHISVHDEDLGEGKLRYVQLSVCTSDTSLSRSDRYDRGRVQVTLVWHAKSYEAMDPTDRKELHRLCAYIWKEGKPGKERESQQLIHSVWVNFNDADTNVILGPRWKRMEGPAWLWQNFGGAEICFHPGSFSQANHQAFNLALRAIHDQVPRGSRVAEFYAGVGAIGISLAKERGCAVDMVEVNSHVRDPFNQSKSRLPPQLQDRVHMNIVSADDMPQRFLTNADVAVVDPPRRGLDPCLVVALNSDKFKRLNRIVYLSCGLESLERDVVQLQADGKWSIMHAEAFNFFPGTDSIETLVVLQKCNPDPNKEKPPKKQLGKRSGGKKKAASK